jgi:hypothetical protein
VNDWPRRQFVHGDLLDIRHTVILTQSCDRQPELPIRPNRILPIPCTSSHAANKRDHWRVEVCSASARTGWERGGTGGRRPEQGVVPVMAARRPATAACADSPAVRASTLRNPTISPLGLGCVAAEGHHGTHLAGEFQL